MLELPSDILQTILVKMAEITKLDPLFLCTRHLVSVSLVNRDCYAMTGPLWQQLDRCYKRDHTKYVHWRTRQSILAAFGFKGYEDFDLSVLETSAYARVKVGALIQKRECICKSKALSEYRLKQSDVASLPVRHIPNPHHAGSAPMCLFDLTDIIRVARDKWESADGLDMYNRKLASAKHKRDFTKRKKSCQAK